MNVEMILTFVILLLTTVLFIHGRLRPDFVAVGSLLSLTLLNIITPAEAFSGFSNSVVIMIAGLFIVGAGIFNTGLAEQMSNRLLKLGRGNETRLLIIIMLTVAFFSAFMSNTGTVAVMLPVVVSMALSIKASPSKFLIPLAFASSLGGVLTLIGTPPNLIVSNTLVENGYEPMSFFGYTPIGMVVLISGTLFMVTIGRRLLPDSGGVDTEASDYFSPEQLAGLYKTYNYLHLIKVSEGSHLIGQKLIDLDLPEKYGVTVVSIEGSNGERLPLMANNRVVIPKTGTSFFEKDLVLLFGEKQQVEVLCEDFACELLSNQTEHEARKHFLTREYGITEVVVTPQSRFHKKTIRELHFRKKYGCNVLALNRNGKYIQTDVGKERLQYGDALLIHGEWDKIELLAEITKDLVVVGRVSETAKTAQASGKAPIAAGIMLFMLVLMTFELIDPVVTVLLAAFLMIITGCVRSTGDAYRSIDWESLILIAAMLPMATALEKTGGVTLISDLLIDQLGGYGPYAVLVGFYILVTILSQFISNTATAVLFAPIAVTTAIGLSVSPYPFLISVAIAAGMAFSTPVASPTNALVLNAGGYKFKDFVKVGVPLQLFLLVITIIVIPLFFPF